MINENRNQIDHHEFFNETPEINTCDSPIHNEFYYHNSEKNNPFEEEYDDLGDIFYPDGPNYRENLTGQYFEMDEYLIDNDPYYDIPPEALIEEELYLSIEDEFEIPDFLNDSNLAEEYKFVDSYSIGEDFIIDNDPYYDDVNNAMEDVENVDYGLIYEDHLWDMIETDMDEDCFYDDYRDDEFYFEDIPQKHPHDEELDCLGDMFYPDGPNYRENLNGQYFDYY